MKTKVNKQILKYGTLDYDGRSLTINKAMAEELKRNFERSPFVPVVRGHASDEEAEKNPFLVLNKNIEKLEIDDAGVNAVFEVEQDSLDKYNDVSVGMEGDYVDHETGEERGWLLRHIALVLNPYIKGLKPFTALSEDKGYLVYLSDIKPMTDEKKVEVEATEEEAKVEETEVKAEEAEAEAKPEETKEEPAEEKEESKEEAVEETEEAEEATEEETTEETAEEPKETVEASDTQKEIVELQEKLAKVEAELSKGNAEKKYSVLLSEGKVMPSMKESLIKLFTKQDTVVKLSEGDKTVGALLDEFFSHQPSLINLSEQGVDIEGLKLSEIPAQVRTDMEKRYKAQHPKATKEDVDTYFSENQDKILKAVEKHKSVLKL